MATTTQLPSIQIDLYDYAGDFADDFDMDAIHRDYAIALEALLPEGIYISVNGDVYATLDAAEVMRDIDINEISEQIDVAAIFERHDVTRRITEQPDGTFHGFDHDGNLAVAFGPDSAHDGDGGPAPEGDHWIATLYDGERDVSTFTGTRAEVQAQARKWLW